MIQGINSSKTAVFVWLFVFIFLFVGLCVTFTMINNNSLEEDKATPEQMNYLYIGSFLFSCLPIGWTARRRMFAKYIHVPTEDIEVFETNLVGNFMTVRQAAIRMREKGKGAIVFIGSNTSYRAIPNRAAYSASKGGINSMSKAFAVDLGKYGIRSNVVLPGTIKTQRWVEMGSKQIVNGTLTPIGDISDFEDIAAAAYFLGSDMAKNITGAEITVDGGMTAQLYPQILNEMKRKLMDME